MNYQHTGDEPILPPNIAYVDEKPDERDNFFTDAYDSGLFGEIHRIDPVADIEEMVELLLNLQIDALVSDFNLTEAAAIGYSGEQLVDRFLQIRADFPCFIRTSFEEDALSNSADVNRVYSKDVNADAHTGSSLFGRIALQVQKHRALIASWKRELEELLAISTEDRSALQVEKLLDLDHKLEASLGADAQIPKDVKEQVLNRRHALQEETERLIHEMKRALGDE